MLDGLSNAAATKIAQLIGDVITHHSHATAHGVERIKNAAKNEWLDDLEAHSSIIVGPIIDTILEKATMSPELRALITEAKEPSAAFGSFVQQFLIYGVMFSIASTALQPLTQELSNTLWTQFPDRPLSPADVATALTQAVDFGDSQGVEIPDWAVAEAKMSGINPERFATIVGIDGQAPDATDLFEMFRRGIITTDQLQNGFLEGPTKNKWIPFLTKLQYVTPSPADMVRAAVQAQLPYAQAEDLAHKLGLEPAGWVEDNPDWFKVMFDIAGRPPGPEEMARAANRNIIPWEGTGAEALTFQQAIAESDVKTKWTDVLKQLAVYFPPNGEISNLLRGGGLTDEQAKALWAQNGVPDDLATAYLHLATIQQVTQERALAKGEILDLVEVGAITDTEAETMLAQIGYSGSNATALIEMTHYRFELRAINLAIRKISAFYTARKITAAQAKSAFEAEGLPDAQVTGLLDTLTEQRDDLVAVPTSGQIAGAFNYGIIDQNTATQMLEHLGYSPFSAWLVLSERTHAALPDQPPIPPELYSPN